MRFGLIGARLEYGAEYKFLDELRQIGVSFVIRIRSEPLMEVVEELPLGYVDRTDGVTWQGLVKLGSHWEGPPIRVVRVEVDGHQLMLATVLKIFRSTILKVWDNL